MENLTQILSYKKGWAQISLYGKGRESLMFLSNFYLLMNWRFHFRREKNNALYSFQEKGTCSKLYTFFSNFFFRVPLLIRLLFVLLWGHVLSQGQVASDDYHLPTLINSISCFFYLSLFLNNPFPLLEVNSQEPDVLNFGENRVFYLGFVL